ncbi:GTP-binding protein Era [Blattabacterium punctulatus CPU2]|uniref:GTPase Era n=1 Tax=Blattabacterium punctulatus CPU2 TaxID=1457032 RepID=A0AAD1CM92_9FLAO|nr:GTPase Era [Blattabacterium punctulatus]AWU39104.1 GTPase Era [Blattabacterium punctulatus]BBA18018.1 GTP-binding protein Era [Blattabacterium punctulatus CPU2]
MINHKHKSGFVNIIGFPNVGKSTLMNSLVGENISIITNKPQTTRHRILGIIDQYNYQIIFSDTPGIMIKPIYSMQKIMMQYVKKSFEDADIVLFTTEIGKFDLLNKYLSFLNFLKEQKIPILILINKIDKIGVVYSENMLYDTINYWNNFFPNSEILPISALKNINQDLLLNKILDLLSQGPPYYPKGILSDRSERFFVNEIIREKIFLMYKKEIPYSVEISTEKFKNGKNSIHIDSSIYVERDSQKGILIGKKGNSINKLGYFSIQGIENFFSKKVWLRLNVKICKNWRSNYKKLQNFGY